MTDCTKQIILILLLWISELRLISSSTPYCEFDSCHETEYCCEANKCCSLINDNVYIMAWVLAGLLVITILFGVAYKCKNRLYRFFSRGSESESLNPKV